MCSSHKSLDGWDVHYISWLLSKYGARSSVVGWGTMLQAGRSQVQFPTRSLDFSIDLILPATLWPWGRLSLQQKWVPGIFLGVKDSRRIRLTASPPSVSRLSKENVWPSTSRNPMGLHGLLQGKLYLLLSKYEPKTDTEDVTCNWETNSRMSLITL
jgi:hypothetical protein